MTTLVWIAMILSGSALIGMTVGCMIRRRRRAEENAMIKRFEERHGDNDRIAWERRASGEMSREAWIQRAVSEIDLSVSHLVGEGLIGEADARGIYAAELREDAEGCRMTPDQKEDTLEVARRIEGPGMKDPRLPETDNGG